MCSMYSMQVQKQIYSIHENGIYTYVYIHHFHIHKSCRQPTLKKLAKQKEQFNLATHSWIYHFASWDGWYCYNIHTLPETNIAPENRPGPKRKQSYSNHPFSGAKMLVSGRVLLLEGSWLTEMGINIFWLVPSIGTFQHRFGVNQKVPHKCHRSHEWWPFVTERGTKWWWARVLFLWLPNNKHSFEV